MRSVFFFLFLLLSVSTVGFSQEAGYRNEFGFRSDNDAYLAYGQDRYYTNGLFIYLRRATDQTKLPKNLNKLIWEVEGGQKMYNPQSGQIADISLIDRPFAGYLYAGGSVNFLFQTENSLKISIQAGAIGPNAKGKETQELLHSIVGFYDIKGWQWQVSNETSFNTSVNYKNLLFRNDSKKLDLSIDSYLNLGNTFSGAGVGVLFRTGDLNQLFHSAITESAVSHKSESKDLADREFFFYAKPILNYVAYDATIQGGLFSSNKGAVVFDSKPLVFSQQAGVMFSKKRWTADFSLTFKSREVKSTARPHQYGSAALSYRFN